MNREFLKELGLTDEQIESTMKEHGKTIQSVKPDDYDELKSANATFEQQLTDLKATIETKETELNSVEEIKQQLESERLNNLKLSIAHQASIPFEFADRLNGTNEEELKADAEKMAGFVNKKQPLPMKHTEPSVDDKDAELKNMLGNLTKQN